MEREGGGGAARRREQGTTDDVIVLSPAPPVGTQKAAATGAEVSAAAMYEAPGERMFYKTRLCDRYETTGQCMYGEHCTFAHGTAELRPSMNARVGGWGRLPQPQLPPPPPQADHEIARGFGGLRATTKVCFMFRDKGSCHFGEKCNFPHVSAEEIRHPGGPILPEPARRIATQLPAPRTFESAPLTVSSAHGNSGYASIAAAAGDPSQQPDQDVCKPITRLEILSRKKLTGIYGDWLEGYPKP